MKNFLFQSRRGKIGAQPGAMVLVGERKQPQVKVEITTYAADSCDYRSNIATLPEFDLPSPPYITWINVIGLHDAAIVEELGQRFHIHPLTQEDILNTDQRPKAEVFDDYIFMVLK
ncbi:MAG: CorA family divalent cation transporter, partial [Victivallales bacterium]|nr:CorA family divalent cation transporter [Victivallales bacterium]